MISSVFPSVPGVAQAKAQAGNKVLPFRKKEEAQPAALKFQGAFDSKSLYDDAAIDFSMPVTSETVGQLKQALLQFAKQKSQLGGSVKLFIHSPGGEVSSGNRILDLIDQLDAPVDTIVDGGMAASMGSFLFLAGKRRIMTPSGQLMVHPPNLTFPGNVPLSEPDLSSLAANASRTRKRGEHYIAKKTGLPVDEVSKMMDRETYIEPLKALKLGFATHVLVGNGRALVKESVQHLSDQEIDERDLTKNYDDLDTVPFDPMNADPDKIRALQQRQSMEGMLGGGRGLPPGMPSRRGPSGEAEHLAAPRGEKDQPAAHAHHYELTWSNPNKLDLMA